MFIASKINQNLQFGWCFLFRLRTLHSALSYLRQFFLQFTNAIQTATTLSLYVEYLCVLVFSMSQHCLHCASRLILKSFEDFFVLPHLHLYHISFYEFCVKTKGQTDAKITKLNQIVFHNHGIWQSIFIWLINAKRWTRIVFALCSRNYHCCKTFVLLRFIDMYISPGHVWGDN